MPSTIDPAEVRRFYVFRGLTEEQARTAAEHLELLNLGRGDVLFRQGQPGDHAYLLVSGRIEIRVAVPQQPDRVLATLLSGSILGEISLLLDEPRTATAVAGTESRLWGLSRQALEDGVQRGEAWACEFQGSTARVLAQRLTRMDQHLVELLSQSGPSGPPPAWAELQKVREQVFAQIPYEDSLFSPSASNWRSKE
jgi:CRP/FNR family transcriptional regulator, cyclic AMP receptor protein